MEQASTKISGARESSAGDDFHLLWAGRKALQLLLPNAKLQALGVEGPAREDAEFLDPEGDKLLAVDLAEYFGGADFIKADKIVLSQLKYSTRNPFKEWTAARLCEGKGRTGSGSVTRRLAETFERYYTVYGRENVLRKLKLKLVTNRPVSKRLLSALIRAQEFLSGWSSGIETETLLDNMQGDDLSEIERLHGDSGLGSFVFTDFLRIFDVSDCGEKSRFGQRIELVKELGQHSVREVQSQYTELKNLIWNCMMPEAWTRKLLTKYDILPIFGFPTYRSAFPAEPKFELPPKVLERKKASELAKIVLQSAGKPVCLHSGGGKGKTILAQMLEKELPPHSVVIVFDCYGGGTYLNPADIRHTHSRAIPQIANELAGRIGGPLLLRFDLPVEDLLREFLGRVETAVSLIQKSNADALVVIGLDAADNSVQAAKKHNQVSFVQDLIKQPFPEGARLVISCRTENRGSLNLPIHESFELGGFETSESAAHLRLYFPEATNQQAAEFHLLTKGIPRTQGYTLNKWQNGLIAVLSPLRPSGKSLEQFIEARIQEAMKRSGIPDAIDIILKALITLPRPVPVAYVAEFAGVSSGAVESFLVDIGFGLVLDSEGTISFRDQDFEGHLRQRISDVECLTDRIADLLYSRRQKDHYAAYHLDSFLAHTGRFQELCNLVLEEDLGEIVKDPVERQEIKLRRIQSALKVRVDKNACTDIVKLLFVAAETVKTDAAVRKLIMENSDLAERFGDPHTVQRLHLNVAGRQWAVPDLFLCAKVLSRFESTKGRARENLKEAHGWLRWWSGLPKNQQHGYPIEDKDIAAGAEAILRLQGVNSARAWLAGWRPPRVIYNCAYLIASSILQVDGTTEFDRHLSMLTLRADIALAIIRACQEAKVRLPVELVKRAVKVWQRFARRGRQPAEEILPDGITLCEAAAQEISLQQFLPELLALFAPPIMAYAPYLHGDEERRVDALLRSQILQARLAVKKIALENFLPDELKSKKEGLPYSERQRLDRSEREFKRIFGSLLPAYELRADALLKAVSKEAAQARFKACLTQIERDYEISWEHDSRTIYRLMALALADAALLISDDAAIWLQETEKTILRKRGGGGNLLQLSLAEKAASRPQLHGEALRLLSEVRQDLEQSPGTASEQMHLLLRCARIALAIDPDVARHFFKLAVGAASEIDEEAYAQIACSASFAEKAAADPQFSDPELAYHLARFAEDCHRRMYGGDHFPWQDIVKGLSSLDPASAFAILSRWDDRGVINIGDEILTLLLVSVERGFISPEVAYALSIMAGPFDSRYEVFSTTALDKAANSGGRDRIIKLLGVIAEDIQLHAPIKERKGRASAVVTWAKEHNFSNCSGTYSLVKLVDFLDRIKEQSEGLGTEWKGDRPQEMPIWDNLLGSRLFITPDEIEPAIVAVKEYDKYGHTALKELMKRIQDLCGPKNYIAQLNALIQVNKESLPDFMLLEALDNRFEKWKVHPAVLQWRKANAINFLEGRFGELFIQDRFMSHRFDEFLRIFRIPDEEVFDLIIRVIPDWIGVPAQAMYDILQQILPSLSQAEARLVLEWILQRLSGRLRADSSDGPWREELRPPKEMVEVLARFLWGLFGHPDKRLRWRAAHAVRRMVRLGEINVVDALVSLSNDKECPIFRTSKHFFFWLSARLWVFILLDRLAKEAPEVVKLHSKRIVKEAIEPSVPHSLICYFAKSAALGLSKRYSRLYSHNERAKLEAVNKSPFAKIKRKRSSMARNKAKEKTREGRFRFNSLDTIPYWYQPLAAHFGGGEKLVVEIAERWICDEWGFGNEDVSNDKLRRRYDWGLYANHQGAEPIVETLGTYLEWHAMLCAADELLRNRPLLQDEWQKDPFGHWLARWTLAWPNFWLVDMRDPVPLVDIYWSLDPPKSENWEDEIPADAFDPLVGLPESPCPGFLVLSGLYRRAIREGSESMDISSALVTPETAPALLRALQTAVNPWDYRVPPEGDELEIADREFELKGWLKGISSEWGGIDKKDPLCNNLSGYLIVPGRDVMEWGSFVSSPDKKFHWRKGNDGKLETILECWDDLQATEHEYHGFYSQGHRLLVRMETLLAYLRARDRSLIVKCMIMRWADKKGMEKHAPGKAKIYLVHGDGAVETLRGRYRLGQTTG